MHFSLTKKQEDKVYPHSSIAGSYGGWCQCPSGQRYLTGEIPGSFCSGKGKLSCKNGKSLSCHKGAGPWSYKHVVCGVIFVYNNNQQKAYKKLILAQSSKGENAKREKEKKEYKKEKKIEGPLSGQHHDIESRIKSADHIVKILKKNRSMMDKQKTLISDAESKVKDLNSTVNSKLGELESQVMAIIGDAKSYDSEAMKLAKVEHRSKVTGGQRGYLGSLAGKLKSQKDKVKGIVENASKTAGRLNAYNLRQAKNKIVDDRNEIVEKRREMLRKKMKM